MFQFQFTPKFHIRPSPLLSLEVCSPPQRCVRVYEPVEKIVSRPESSSNPSFSLQRHLLLKEISIQLLGSALNFLC